MTHAIVRQDFPNAVRLKAPDFGADVLDDPTGRKPRVWQVKHYPGEIHWSTCAKSRDRALSKWNSAEITFVFPRDLTGKEQQEFNEKLVKGQSIPVTRWTATDLNNSLERFPAIRRSYFEHRTDEMHKVLCAVGLSTKPPRRSDGPRNDRMQGILEMDLAGLEPATRISPDSGAGAHRRAETCRPGLSPNGVQGCASVLRAFHVEPDPQPVPA